MQDPGDNAALSSLPSIDTLLSDPGLSDLLGALPRPRAVAALRKAVARARDRLRAQGPGFGRADVEWAVRALSQPGLRRVLNATGVVLHTNLGRAPLAARAVERVAAVAAGYSNLEYDLQEGERGDRYAPVRPLLRALTGAEDCVVVNNNAAAVLLVLAALSTGKEALVSRGELVEIGGGFRIPDVMRQSGAHLVEVGTTNRTRLADYEQALSERTGLLVKVHKSNFAQVGFVEEVGTRALVQLGKSRGVPVFEDLGSGALVPLALPGSPPEPTVTQALAEGADVVTFSGDKLLGGPQAGVIVGRAELLAQIRRHPLNRALRVDKLTVAALEATLELYRDGLTTEVPAVAFLMEESTTLRARALRLQALLANENVEAEVEECQGQVGGGAMPLAGPASYACVVAARTPDAWMERLRAQQPPVIARVSEGRLWLDVRCLGEEELRSLAQAVGAASRELKC